MACGRSGRARSPSGWFDRGQAVLGDRGEGHPVPPGAPHRRRPDQVQAHLLGRRRGGQLRRHRQGLRPRRRRDGHPHRRGLRRPAADHVSRAIDVLQFVPAEQVDPILFNKAYYLEPEGAATKPYVLLRDALTDVRPGGDRQGGAAPARAAGHAAGARRRAGAQHDAVAGRGPHRRLRLPRRGHRGAAAGAGDGRAR